MCLRFLTWVPGAEVETFQSAQLTRSSMVNVQSMVGAA